MRALTAQDILHVWERGQRQHPIDRALTLLAAASPGATRAALADLTVGRRDARLLALHESTFAGTLHCVDTCPQCAVQVEFDAAPSELLVSDADEDEAEETPPRDEVIEDGDTRVRFRLPTSVDLAAAAACGVPNDARALLLRRCVNAATAGQPVDAAELPEPIVSRIVERMAERDPQAEIVLGLTCPECGHQWKNLLDIAEFFWVDLAVQAHHVLADVHTLAREYGWRESDILAMSSVRRQLYLEMVGA